MEPKTIKFLIRLYIFLAFVFGGLTIFSVVVSWAKPILPIAIANLLIVSAMAIVNSIVLDRSKQ